MFPIKKNQAKQLDRDINVALKISLHFVYIDISKCIHNYVKMFYYRNAEQKKKTDQYSLTHTTAAATVAAAAALHNGGGTHGSRVSCSRQQNRIKLL